MSMIDDVWFAAVIVVRWSGNDEAATLLCLVKPGERQGKDFIGRPEAEVIGPELALTAFMSSIVLGLAS